MKKNEYLMFKKTSALSLISQTGSKIGSTYNVAWPQCRFGRKRRSADSSDYSSDYFNSDEDELIFDKFMHPSVFEASDDVTSLQEKYPGRFENQQSLINRVVHGVSVAAGKTLLVKIFKPVTR